MVLGGCPTMCQRWMLVSRRWITFGIRREEKSVWESRAPLSPRQVSQLRDKHGVQFVIQPSTTRVYADREYQAAGAVLSEDLSACDAILGVKEVPPGKILPNKTFVCFSHTHKGQPHNMPMLKKFVDSNCTLIDYELLKDTSGARLVAFGRFAGYAGMINCLHGMGLQLLHHGFRTPFLNVALSHTYLSLDAARTSLRQIGEQIKLNGLAEAVRPLLILFTGNGNVSKGAQEIARELPIKFIDPTEVKTLVDREEGRGIYASVLGPADYCRHKEGGPFVMEEYLKHPDRYQSRFHEDYAPHATAIVNGIYWESRFPRLLTKAQADDLCANPHSRLLTIADISCDIEGSIEITHKASNIDDPFFEYKRGSRAIQVMSIDNLPAQLPRDATEYFGRQLQPVLENMIQNSEDPIIKGATITRGGSLCPPHQWLSSVMVGSRKKKLLVLGSGYVAGPVVQHLGSRRDFAVTIASNSGAEATQISKLAEQGAAVELLDIADGVRMEELVREADVVVSLVPATMHLPIAQACLRLGKDLVTASYISPSLQELHSQVVARRLTFLNEIGLDPGLDHLSAKKVIDHVQATGSRIVSFKSWCGGLPAPECADNPLAYKFSWNPRGVLLAALNDARYRMNGETVQVSGNDLLSSVWTAPFRSPLSLEGIPNRDSLKYSNLYGLQRAETMLRGTLRYAGFCGLMQEFRQLGLFDLGPLSEELKRRQSWAEAIQLLLAKSGHVPSNNLLQAMDWLGMTSSGESFETHATLLDSFCALLQKKLQYSTGERDMVVMHHEFLIEGPQGREVLESSLIEYGQPEGFSAMARTVGYPVAVAAEMIADGQVAAFGVIAPVTAQLYEPLLARLEKIANIRFKETRHVVPSAPSKCRI